MVHGESFLRHILVVTPSFLQVVIVHSEPFASVFRRIHFQDWDSLGKILIIQGEPFVQAFFCGIPELSLPHIGHQVLVVHGEPFDFFSISLNKVLVVHGKALVLMVTQLTSPSRVDLRQGPTVIVSQMIFGTSHSGWNGGRKVSGSVESLEVLIAVQVVKV